MFRCESRTRSENSNFPLKQVDNRLRDIPLARHLAAALPNTSIPTVSNPKPEIHPPPSGGCIHEHEFAIWSLISRSPAILRLHSQSYVRHFSKFKFFPPNTHTRHLAASFTIHKRSPSSGCTRNHVHTQRLSFFKIPHQNPFTTARHLATMSKTRN